MLLSNKSLDARYAANGQGSMSRSKGRSRCELPLQPQGRHLTLYHQTNLGDKEWRIHDTAIEDKLHQTLD